jgi:hypothetical protein
MMMAEQCGALAKYDGDPLLDLLKVGARHSSVDAARLKTIHDAAVDMGADCAGAAKAAPGGDLAKADTGALQKLVADAVAPLQKALEGANAEITKLKAQPAIPRVALRAVAKGEDLGDNTSAAAQPKVIKDDHGEVHDAATLIKSLHQTGGQALVRPQSSNA